MIVARRHVALAAPSLATALLACTTTTEVGPANLPADPRHGEETETPPDGGSVGETDGAAEVAIGRILVQADGRILVTGLGATGVTVARILG
jgi:hypothetical protein